MASHPDNNPDSPPAGSPDAIEQVSPSPSGGRTSIEDTPGPENSTGGAGDEIVQDQQYER